MPKKPIAISSRKAKGRACRNWVCEKVSQLTGYVWGKDEMIAGREMGQTGVDVRLVADAKTAFPWSVECKWQESLSLPSAVKQAKDNQQPGTDWLLITKRNRDDFLAILEAEGVFDLF